MPSSIAQGTKTQLLMPYPERQNYDLKIQKNTDM
jgi:hypothetical protein